ncbi:MAG: CotH kinase family protein [Flavobacteriales bacterium]
MKKFLVALFFVLTYLSQHAQPGSFYDQATIQTIEIFFAQSNWDALLDQQAQSTEDYIIADSVRVNGTTFEQVGVKYKGNSSYNANNAKNPLHIELDNVIEQDYQHYTDIKLGNGFSDPSYIREALSYDILKNYMDCPLSNFANVYINGNLRGLYSNDESINKHFLGNHYYSAESELFKCNPMGGAGPGGGGNPDLVWLGADSSLYQSRYELKSDYGWNELVRLIDTLANNTGALENILDVDRAIWMLAYNNVLVNLDSYTGNFKQNYYLYKDVNGRWVPTIWDLNMSFGGFPGNGLSVSGMQNLSPIFSNDAAHPLIQKLLANARYRKMYIAHMRTIADEFFDSGLYLDRADFFRSVIDAAVQIDPNGFYSYTQFQNSLTTNTTGGGGGPGGGIAVPGIQVLMDARNSYLQGTTEFSQQPPVISNVQPASAPVNYGGQASIQASVVGATSVFLGFRNHHPGRFFRISMFDDGQHNDGGSGDGVFGTSFPVDGTQPEFYVWAENANAGAFSPARAEHEFYTVAVDAQPLTTGTVVINEVLTSNSVQEDEYGESNDWIELFNTSNAVIDLGGSHLTDTVADPLRWTFREGTLLAPGEYLIVWADDDEEQWFQHTNFNLSSVGETLLLTDVQGNVIDEVTYPLQTQDVSYGRYPNGSGPWTYMETTYAGINSMGLNGIETNPVHGLITAYPNPTHSNVRIQSSEGTLHRITLTDLQGRIALSTIFGTSRFDLSVEGLDAGLYLLAVELADGVKETIRIVKN